jgi:hypothetical protein
MLTELSLLAYCVCLMISGTLGRGNKPTKVVIGGLFPYNVDGAAMAVGSTIALENARNQSSGLEPLSWFKKNPNVTISMHNASSEGSQRGAFEAAIACKDAGAKIIVGPAYSTESVVVSLLSNVFEFCIISYASTSPRLSDKTAYPYFFRNVPSDNAQGIALAELVKFLKQTKCIVVHTDESYGLGLLTVFRERAALLNITIVTTLTLPSVRGAAGRGGADSGRRARVRLRSDVARARQAAQRRRHVPLHRSVVNWLCQHDSCGRTAQHHRRSVHLARVRRRRVADAEGDPVLGIKRRVAQGHVRHDCRRTDQRALPYRHEAALRRDGGGGRQVRRTTPVPLRPSRTCLRRTPTTRSWLP